VILGFIGVMCNTYNETELVEAVDDIDHGPLAAFVEIRRLEERCLWNAEIFGCVVEVLDVAQSHKTALCIRLESCRRLSNGCRQFVYESKRKHKAMYFCSRRISWSPWALRSFNRFTLAYIILSHLDILFQQSSSVYCRRVFLNLLL